MIKRLFAITFAALLITAPQVCGQEILSPVPKLHFDDANGAPLSGGKLFVYAAGTTTKTNTYTTSSGGTPNVNPVILDTRGEANVWLTPGTLYKFVLSPSTDTDPPTNPIYTVDNISVAGSASGGQYTGAVVTTSTLMISAIETYSVNASGTTIQRLPAVPLLWERHTIVDQAGNAATFQIDLSGNGNQIASGGALYSDFYVAFNGQSVSVQWNGTQWNVE